jgi:uracil phosphoribosyltransferase
MVKILGDSNTLLNKFLYELRSVSIQNDTLRFRRNLERISEVFAYEISKTFSYKPVQAQTPLGIADMMIPDDDIVIASIMRAGMPMHNGFLNYFDGAENAFISAYRKYGKDGAFKIAFEHLSCPSIDGKVLILADPMLATGASMVLSYNELVKRGTPKHTHIVSIVASKEGVEYAQKNLPSKNVTIWLGALDDELTVKSYIVPGLGDAGDLAYGSKE